MEQSIKYDNVYPLKVTTLRKATTIARTKVAERRDGIYPILKTRWKGVNKLMLGGFEFGTVNLIAGLSGHGKSYMLGMLHQDFLNDKINPSMKDKIKILHFNFEMNSYNEVLRWVSSMVNIPYQDLMSAENPLPERELGLVNMALNSLHHDNLLYSETPGNRLEIAKTIMATKERFPDHSLVVTLDHTLLVKQLDEKDEIDLVSKLAKQMIELKKLGILIILIGQLNDKIEQPIRRDPKLHFPTSTDIFGSKQIIHAVDTAWVIHMPEKLNIIAYGPKAYPTQSLVVFHLIKNRFNVSGHVRLRNVLIHGSFVDWKDEEPEKILI